MVSRQNANTDNKRLYEKLSNFSSSKKPLWVAFLWGLLEGTFFFIVPDFFTGFVGLFNRKKALLSCLSAVLGSLVGGIIMFGLALVNGMRINAILEKIPGISSSMIASASSQLHSNGLVSLVGAPLQGIPYKVYAVQAALHGIGLSGFLLWSIPARFERILPATLLAMAAGYLFRKSVKKRTALWTAAYGSVWIVIYLFYFMKV